MKILINSNPLKAFTSGTPQRGLIEALCTLRAHDNFTLLLSNDNEAAQLSTFWERLVALGNVEIINTTQSQKIINIKKLIGFRVYQKWPNEFDFYLSPGMPEYFATKNQPSLSTVADLSSINLAGNSSLKWHGNRIFKNTLNWCVKSNSAIGAISDFTKKELVEKHPKKKERFFTLHNGIENFWFDTTYQENTTTKLYKNKSYGIWWGLGSNRKNLFRTLTAYLELKKEKPDLFELLLVGSLSPDQTQVQSLIETSNAIHLIPFQQPYILKSLVKHSKGLVFPSLYEGFGLPIIETYSQGKPVLYGNLTSMPEIASDYGIPVNPYDVQSIKNGLLQLNNHDTSMGYAQQVKQYASRFTYSNAAIKLSGIIDQIIQ